MLGLQRRIRLSEVSKIHIPEYCMYALYVHYRKIPWIRGRGKFITLLMLGSIHE
jgi:hypothetical protein